MAKIDKIDTSNMSVKEIKALEKQLEKEAKIAKAEEKEKAKQTDEFDSSSKVKSLDDYQVENYVKNYIEKLIKKYDGYDDIISRLRSYLGNFDIDEFRKDYPELSNTSDLATAMYNDTQKFL